MEKYNQQTMSLRGIKFVLSKERMSKELKESITMAHQSENINKEIEI